MGFIKNRLVILIVLPFFQLLSLDCSRKSNYLKDKPQQIIIPPDIGPIYQQIQLNEFNTVQLSHGSICQYEFIPSDNEFYVVETFGVCDTVLRIENTYTGDINDDDSGENYNSKISFKAIANQTIYIYVKLLSAFSSGSFELQLRRQYFSMFGFEDQNGNSTICDLDNPEDDFDDIFNCARYENVTASHALGTDERGLPRLDSEIMFFTGHGYKNTQPTVEMGFGVMFNNSGITIDTPMNLSQTKFAMWSACYSSNSFNHWNKSIAEYSVDCGAKSALGFQGSISFWSANHFTNDFFSYLSNGYSVEDSASMALTSFPFFWDSIFNHTIFGDNDIVVTASTISNCSFLPIYNRKVDSVLIHFLDGEYQSYPIGHNVIRYYDTVEQCITNSYLDVKYDKDGNIEWICDQTHQSDTIYPQIFNAFDFSLDKSIVLDSDYYLKQTNSYIAFCYLDNAAYPVLFLDGTYDNALTSFQLIKCYNLYSGEELEYSDLCTNIVY